VLRFLWYISLQIEIYSVVKPSFVCSVLVANAGVSFAEQLDASHKNSCPWRGSSCANSLVQLHLAPSQLLEILLYASGFVLKSRTYASVLHH
jgi:hypothetical protein